MTWLAWFSALPRVLGLVDAPQGRFRKTLTSRLSSKHIVHETCTMAFGGGDTAFVMVEGKVGVERRRASRRDPGNVVSHVPC